MYNNYLLTVLIALLLVSTSCSDDDGDEFGDIPEALVGTWNSITLEASGCADDSDNGSCTVGCLNLVFSEDGAVAGTLFNETLIATVTANDNIIRICDPTGDCTDITYTIGELTTEVSWTDSEDGCTYSATIVKPEFPAELVGTWTSDAATASGCDDSDDNGNCDQDCLTYTFVESGAFTGRFAQEAERNGFGYANGSTLNLCWSGDLGCQAVTYSVNGDSGEVSWDDNEDGCSYEATINKQ